MRTAKRAAIFDLDGTLIDSLPDLAAAVNATLAAWRRPALSPDQVRLMIGDGADTLIRRAFAVGGGLPGPVAPVLARFLEIYEAASTVLTRPWPGVVETLEHLRGRGITLAVCTNKPSAATRDILKVLDLDRFFAVVIGGDDSPALKPDPAPVNATLARLGVAHGDAVMIGDSINDVLSAKAAGVATVAVSFGYTRIPPHDLGADRVIDHFNELPPIIAGTE